MKIDLDIVRGFSDHLPFESNRRALIKDIVAENARLHGFSPFEAPLIEVDELFREDHLQDQKTANRFRLKDKTGRNLSIRFELKKQLERVIKQARNISIPSRIFSIGDIIKDEPMGPEKSRQRSLCDIFILGNNSKESEIELLLLLSDILKKTHVESTIEINNQRLVEELLDSINIQEKDKVFEELAKLPLIGEDLVKSNLKKYADTTQILTLFKMLEKDLQFFLTNAFDGAKELDAFIIKLRLNDINVEFSPKLIKSKKEFSSFVFEAYNEDSDTIAIGGGFTNFLKNSEDKLISACGTSIFLDTLTKSSILEPESVPKIIISSDNHSLSYDIAKRLRDNKISCIILNNQKEQLIKYAESAQIPYILFLEKKETFNFYEISKKEEKEFNIDEIIELLS